MRPDHYKQARARSYKAKHGLLDKKRNVLDKAEAEATSIPTNISAELIDAFSRSHLEEADNGIHTRVASRAHPSLEPFEVDDVDEILAQSSDSSQLLSVDIPYPKELFERVLPVRGQRVELTDAQVDSHVLRHLSRSELANFGSDTDHFIVTEGRHQVMRDVSAAGEASIVLQRQTRGSNATPEKPSPTTPARQEQREIEDWLDELL